MMMRVMRALYAGMVLEAEEAAHYWSELSDEEREKYWQTALFFAQQQSPTYTLQERIEQVFNCVLVVRNFFRDANQLYDLGQEFKNIIFEANALSSRGVTQTQSSQYDIEQIKALYPSLEAYEYMERQRHLFEQMRPKLMQQYRCNNIKVNLFGLRTARYLM